MYRLEFGGKTSDKIDPMLHEELLLLRFVVTKSFYCRFEFTIANCMLLDFKILNAFDCREPKELLLQGIILVSSEVMKNYFSEPEKHRKRSIAMKGFSELYCCFSDQCLRLKGITEGLSHQDFDY